MQHLRKHQSAGQKIRNDPPEKGLTRNTAPSRWIGLGTMKNLEKCLKELHRGVYRKRRNWSKQQKAEVNKLELRSQLGRTWEKLLLEYFENEMSQPSSAQLLMANPFTRTERQCFSRGSWLELHWKIWTHVTHWSSGTKLVCVPDDDVICCFMQHLSQHKSVGQQIRNDPPEKGLTRNTAPSRWIGLDTMKNLENCLKRSCTAEYPESVETVQSRRKQRWICWSWGDNMGERGRNWCWNTLRTRWGHTSSVQPLMANPFTRTEGHLMFTWPLAEAALKDLNSCDKMKFGDKSLYV